MKTNFLHAILLHNSMQALEKEAATKDIANVEQQSQLNEFADIQNKQTRSRNETHKY